MRSVRAEYPLPGVPLLVPPLGTGYRREMAERSGFLYYDEPIWRDWLFYLTLLACVAVAPTQETVIDFVLAIAFQMFLFGIVPGWIRERVRKR